MDLADATLVAFAEEHGHRRIFTLDSDFHVYRIRGRQRSEVVPPSLTGYPATSADRRSMMAATSIPRATPNGTSGALRQPGYRSHRPYHSVTGS